MVLHPIASSYALEKSLSCFQIAAIEGQDIGMALPPGLVQERMGIVPSRQIHLAEIRCQTLFLSTEKGEGAL